MAQVILVATCCLWLAQGSCILPFGNLADDDVSGGLPCGDLCPHSEMSLGSFATSFYWLEHEKDYPGEATVPLYRGQAEVLATVSDEFAKALTMEGTGVLTDGRMVNLLVSCSFAKYGWCFTESDPLEAPFGAGSYAPLVPFFSVALHQALFLQGEVVYSPQFDGLPLPGSPIGDKLTHSGCLAVADTGWSLALGTVDIFVWDKPLHKEVAAGLNVDHVELVRNSPNCPGTVWELYNLLGHP